MKQIKNSKDIKKIFKRKKTFKEDIIVVKQSFEVDGVKMLIDKGAHFAFHSDGFVISGINISLFV